MKNRLVILATVVSLTLITVIASIIGVSAKNSNKDSLILKEYNGCIALYEGERVIEIYDEIVISVLPKADRDMLINGITIEDEEQLQSILEDYDG